MQKIQSIVDIKGNINLDSIEEIRLYEPLIKDVYEYVPKTESSFFGLFHGQEEYWVNHWFTTTTHTKENILEKGYIILENEVYEPSKVIIYFKSRKNSTFQFENYKQSSKFVRELNKLLTDGQKWLKKI